MDTLQIEAWQFFGVLQLAVVLLLLAGFLFLRGRALAARLRRLQGKLQALKKTQPGTETAAFDDCLREQIAAAPALLEHCGGEGGDTRCRELLELRTGFLQLELEAQPLKDDPAAFAGRLLAALGELADGPGAPADAAARAGSPTDDAERPTVDTRDAELDHLRQVINNQQDTMKVLREQLQEQEFEGLTGILEQLDAFERQSAELEQCLLVLERENESLKAARAGGEVDLEALESGRFDGLQSMVGQQQDTIDSLRGMIRELAPEAGKAAQLEQAMESIQSANRELTGCVAVLEDENALLRSELEQIQSQLAQQQLAEGAPTAAPIGTDAAGDEMAQVLQKRVGELEALLEFKEAAIGEMETQIARLEAQTRSLDAGRAAG